MNSKHWIALVVVFLLGYFFGTGPIATASPRMGIGTPQGTEKADNGAWEYLVLAPKAELPDLLEPRRKNFEDLLVEAGKDGWEYCDAPYLKGVRYQVIVMKRPKKSQ